MRRALTLLLLASTALSATGCTDQANSASDTPTVGVAFYPIADIVMRLGLSVHPTIMVPPGQEVHEFDPTPKQLTELEDTTLFFYFGEGFQPNVESALESLPSSVTTVDLLDGVTLLPVTDPLAGTQGDVGGESLDGDLDPHVWLDPTNMAQMTAVVADRLVEAGLATRAAADSAVARATADYDRLDLRFRDALAVCARRDLVTTHRAFGYLAAAYDLAQVSIAGVSPAEEPSAKTLQSVAQFVRDHGVTTIFSEDTLPADLARTVADETGARTATLDTLESPPESTLLDEDYVSLMTANLDAISSALECS